MTLINFSFGSIDISINNITIGTSINTDIVIAIAVGIGEAF